MRALSVLLLALASSAGAQPTDWRTLSPAAGVALPLADGFGAEWDADPGVALGLLAPAYGGHARLSLRVTPYASPRTDLPAFDAAFPSLGWGPRLPLPAGIELAAGPQVGVAYLRFEDDAAFGGNLQNETELTAGAWGRVDVPVVGRLRAWIEADALRVAFARPVTVTTASAGVALRLDTPGWLQAVLR